MKISYSLNEIDKVVEQLYPLINNCTVVTFKGSLGAGKTTLIKKLLAYAGVNETVVSPTYSYVIEYTNSLSKKFYHFDLYRIKTVQDFINAGFEQYLTTPNSMSLIEWPEAIEPVLKNYCEISIEYDGIEKRILIFKKMLK